MSYKDIKSHIAGLYALDISQAAISNITDRLLPELKAWQSRPLDAIYPFVWFDAIHYKVKEDNTYTSKAIYTEGHKELLGLYISENEGASYWVSVLTDLNN